MRPTCLSAAEQALQLKEAGERLVLALRAQRAAYNAWQAAPAGPGWVPALEAYDAANKGVDDAQLAVDALHV